MQCSVQGGECWKAWKCTLKMRQTIAKWWRKPPPAPNSRTVVNLLLSILLLRENGIFSGHCLEGNIAFFRLPCGVESILGCAMWFSFKVQFKLINWLALKSMPLLTARFANIFSFYLKSWMDSNPFKLQEPSSEAQNFLPKDVWNVLLF